MPAPFKVTDSDVIGLFQRNESAYKRALRDLTETKAAERLSTPLTTVNDWTQDHMMRALQMLAAVGLRCVPREERTYPVRRVLAWKELARQALDEDDDDIITAPGALGPAE